MPAMVMRFWLRISICVSPEVKRSIISRGVPLGLSQQFVLEVNLPINVYLEMAYASILLRVSSVKFVLASYLTHSGNLHLLELSANLSRGFAVILGYIASACISTVVSFSDLTVNLWDYFWNEAGLFSNKV